MGVVKEGGRGRGAIKLFLHFINIKPCHRETVTASFQTLSVSEEEVCSVVLDLHLVILVTGLYDYDGVIARN